MSIRPVKRLIKAKPTLAVAAVVLFAHFAFAQEYAAIQSDSLPVDTAAIVAQEVRGAAVDTAAGAAAAAATAAADEHDIRFFEPKRANILLVLVVYFGSVLVYTRRARRGKSLFIRTIPGMIALDEALGRTTEMGRPALYIPGVMDVDNIQTIASMVILTKVAEKCAQLDVPLIVPLNRAFVVPLAEESVREGFLRAGRPDSYIADNVRYLSDEQFAFTAGVAGIMNREKTAAHFFLGAFFAESLIISEVGYSTGAIQIAGTANIHQLPFFVVACDYTLIGEEFYAASAYISKDPGLLGTLKGSDLTKALLMTAIFIGGILDWAGIDIVAKFFGG